MTVTELSFHKTTRVFAFTDAKSVLSWGDTACLICGGFSFLIEMPSNKIQGV